MFNGQVHYKWTCSIAMLNYQRVGYDQIMIQITFLELILRFCCQQKANQSNNHSDNQHKAHVSLLSPSHVQPEAVTKGEPRMNLADFKDPMA